MSLVLIALLIVGFAVSTLASPAVVRRIVLTETVVVITCLAVPAINGFPLMRTRVGRSDVALAPITESLSLTIHRGLGFVTEIAFWFVWPNLVVLPFRSSTGRLARVGLTVTSTLVASIFALVAISAYLLPHEGSTTLPKPLAATILRFAVFHVTFGPAAVALLLVITEIVVFRKARNADREF